MLGTISRRVGTTVGVLAVAGSSAVLAAPAAQAATPASCLQRLEAGFYDNTRVIVAPRTKLKARTTVQTTQECAAMRVSLTISTSDLKGAKTQAAAKKVVRNRYFFATDFASLPGTWIVRQIAVGNSAGQVAIKKYDRNPRPVTAISESRLTGRPTGNVKLPANREVRVQGYLKVYTRFGTWAPLPAGQRILLQARPHTSRPVPYATVGNARTSKSGYWRTDVTVPRGTWDVRIAYVSTYRTIASDTTFLGTYR